MAFILAFMALGYLEGDLLSFASATALIAVAATAIESLPLDA